VTSIETSFSLFFTSEMLELVVKHTNEEVRRRPGGKYKDTDREELEKFMGLLILAVYNNHPRSGPTEKYTPRRAAPRGIFFPRAYSEDVY
jgi:hypothetical protein